MYFEIKLMAHSRTTQLLDVSGDMRTNWKEREAAAKAAAISGPVPEAPPTKIAPPVSVRNVKFGVVNRAKKGSGKPDTVAQMFSDGAGPPSTTGKPSPALKTEVTTKPSDKRKNDVDIQKLLSTQLDDEDVPLTSPTKRRIVESDEDDDYADASTETKKQKL